MKKTIILCIAFLGISVGAAYAQQSAEELIKERRELAKLTRQQLNEKASKDARKQAKQYEKEGWQTTPGSLPIAKQLDRTYGMQYELDDTGFPKYIMGQAMSIGQNYDGAKMQALELAKQDLAAQIQSEVAALVETNVANKQLSPEEAATITESVKAGKSLINQNIGRVITVIEMYRTLKNKNKEVMVRVAYNSDMAKEAAKKAIRKELSDKGDELQGKLDEILNW